MRALEVIDRLSDKLKASEARAREPIAVCGMSCRLPGGVNSPVEYWDLFREGRSGIGPIPEHRWDVDSFYSELSPGTKHTRHGGFLTAIDGFDAPFFRIFPREAATLDPQQRRLLECAWEALEDGPEVNARCVVVSADASSVRGDIDLQRPDGVPVARIRSVETRPMTREQFERAMESEATAVEGEI